MGGNLGGPSPFGGTWGTPGPGGPGTAGGPGGSGDPGAPSPPPWARGYQQPPATPPKRGNKLLIFGGIGAVVVLGLLCALLAALLPGGGGATFSDDPAKHQSSLAASDLTAAAAELSHNPGVRYAGSFRDKHGDEVTVDARLTNLGWTRATLSRYSTKLSVLSNGKRTYLKADKTYWSSHGAPRESVATYARHWVRISPDDLGIDLSRALSPGALAADLELAVERGEVRGGTETTLDGVKVRKIHTRYATVYVTVAAPQHVVRIASRDAASPGPSGKGGSAVAPALNRAPPATGGALGDGAAAGPVERILGPAGPEDFEFDVSGLSPDEVKSLFKELEKRVAELKSSVDSQVTFSMNGGITLKPCTVTHCTAVVSMSNSVTTSSPYLVVKRPVVAVVTIRMTLDGRPVRTCNTSREMRPNGKATVKCLAVYSVPADGRTHHIEAIASAVARATVSADLKQMFADLKTERTKGPAKLPGKDGDLGSRWKPCDPSTIPDDKGGCEKVADKIQKRIGGKRCVLKAPGNLRLGSYRGYENRWFDHTIVVKDGRAYDAWTSRYGEPLEVYLSQWDYADLLTLECEG